jgi:hypothetical protein
MANTSTDQCDSETGHIPKPPGYIFGERSSPVRHIPDGTIAPAMIAIPVLRSMTEGVQPVSIAQSATDQTGSGRAGRRKSGLAKVSQWYQLMKAEPPAHVSPVLAARYPTRSG